MHKLTVLVLTGVIFAASSYQMLATDSLAIGNRVSERGELEIVTRNAAVGAFTQAKLLVEDAESMHAFLSPGRQLHGEYEGAFYRTTIESDGLVVTIRSSAIMSNGVDTVDFSVSATITWSDDDEPYLVLKAYREE